MKGKLTSVTISLILVSLFAISVLTFVKEDREPPRIVLPMEDIVFEEGENTQILLKGVTAIDNREGDVSSTLIIESINLLAEEGKANVIYAARDSKNNVAKAARIINYHEKVVIEEPKPAKEDNNKEKETETESETEKSNQTVDITTPADSNETSVGENTGTATKEPLVSTGDPIIRLNTNAVSINVGDRFNPMNYIAEAVDDKDDVWGRINIEGRYSTKKAGEYTLKYFVRDKDSNESNVETLILTVN